MLSPKATHCNAPVPFCGRKLTRILCNHWQKSMSVESTGRADIRHQNFLDGCKARSWTNSFHAPRFGRHQVIMASRYWFRG
jgi:hypothetical protein